MRKKHGAGRMAQDARPCRLRTAGETTVKARLNPKSQIPNPKSQIPNPKSQIPNPKSQIPNPKS
ncbi:MAG: hypothetical protein EOM83_14750, partial [Clostridia bacterium]|nr:hypothetical protein [Clostridia bacterium]